VRLDYLFTPTRDADRLLSCDVVSEPAEARVASDHFPLVAEID